MPTKKQCKANPLRKGCGKSDKESITKKKVLEIIEEGRTSLRLKLPARQFIVLPLLEVFEDMEGRVKNQNYKKHPRG